MTASISDTLIDAAFAPNLINGERYLSTTNGERYLSTTNGERYLSSTNGERYLSSTKRICSPQLEHNFTKRSLVMTARVDLLLTCSTVSGTRMPPQITVFIHCVIPLNECPFSNPLGLLARGSPHQRLQALVLLYSGKI